MKNAVLSGGSQTAVGRIKISIYHPQQLVSYSGTSAPVSQLSILNSKYGDMCATVCWGRVKGVLFAATTPTEYKDWDREAGGHIFSLPFHNGETRDIMPP